MITPSILMGRRRRERRPMGNRGPGYAHDRS